MQTTDYFDVTMPCVAPYPVLLNRRIAIGTDLTLCPVVLNLL